MRLLFAGLLLSSLTVVISHDTFTGSESVPFNPRLYPKKIATCKALNRRDDVVKQIDIHYVEVNPSAEDYHHGARLAEPLVHLVESDFRIPNYHLIIPDQRGFGPSTHPGDVESSGTMGDLVGDLVCVLEHAGVKSAICLGHDWGAQVCWESARMRPDIFEAVAAAVVPYIPAAGHFVPTAALINQLPRLTYQLFFQDKTDEAITELDRDIRRTLRGTLRSVESPPPEKFLTSKDSFLFGWEHFSEISPIPFMSSDEENYLVEQYTISGFQNTLQFYTHGNRHGSWAFAQSQGNHTIPHQALSIFPTEDPVADWLVAATLLGSAKLIPRLKIKTIAGAAHWPQLEKPAEFNAILREWLKTLPEHYVPEHEHKRFADEL